MNTILGQENLCQTILNYSLDTFPHSVLLVGQKGSGKDLIINFISNHLKLTVNFLETISFESLNDIYINSVPQIYIMENLTIKEQNQILKFLEEPPKTSFIIIKSEYLGQYLDTIQNRCRIFQLERYFKSSLKDFTDNELILSIAETPGEILSLEKSNFKEVYLFAQKVLDKISIASYGNLFNIVDHVKSQELNISIDLFIKVLKWIIIKNIQISQNYSLYGLTKGLESDLNIPHVNKEQLFENYLIKVKEIYDNRRT